MSDMDHKGRECRGCHQRKTVNRRRICTACIDEGHDLEPQYAKRQQEAGNVLGARIEGLFAKGRRCVYGKIATNIICTRPTRRMRVAART